MRNIRELIEEILESMEYSLPDGANPWDVIDNAEWYQDTAPDGSTPSEDHAQLTYQYGRLLGAADAFGESIGALLSRHGMEKPGKRKATASLDGLVVEVYRGADGRLVVDIEGPGDADTDELGSPDLRVWLNEELVYGKSEDDHGPCPGWAHFNIGESREGIERCDECAAFRDDIDAALGHHKHCKCGAGPSVAIARCHHCQVELSEEGEVTIRNHRAFCGARCAQECE